MAVALDPDLSEGHEALGFVLLRYGWDLEGAEREFALATRFGPGDGQAHQFHSQVLLSLVRYDEALREAARGFDLDPYSPGTNVLLAFALWHAGQIQEAEEQFRRTIRLAPDFSVGYSLVEFLTQQSRRDEAADLIAPRMEIFVRQYDAVLKEIDSSGVIRDSLPMAIADAFRDPELRPRAVSLIDRLEQDGFPLAGLGFLFRLVGASGEANDILELLIDDRHWGIPYINWLHRKAVLEGDPRYPAILQELGLRYPPG